MPPKKRELHDAYFLKAKAEGYAARSAYKLLEIQDRRHLLKRGMWVLDLGCAPGSWLQVASKMVGSKGRVAGVDLQPVTIELPENCRAGVGDVFKLTAQDMLDLLGGAVDVVLSDMAPATTGDPGGDHFRSVDLCRRVLELVAKGGILRDGGALVMKVFEGESYPTLLKDTSRLFHDTRGLKPEASRDVSREMFIIATGYQGAPVEAPKASTPGVAPKRPAPRAGWGGGA